MTFKASSTILSLAVIGMLAACGSSEDAATDTASSAAESAGASEFQAIIEARQGQYKKLGKAFKTISDQLRSGSPDMSIIESATASVPEITKGIETWFPAGSGPESGIKTAALPAIWEKPAEFTKAVGNFKAASMALVAAGKTGDATAITAAFRGTGGTCKGCHDNFKSKDD